MNDPDDSFEPTESSARMWSQVVDCSQEPGICSVSVRVTEIRYTACRGAGEVLLLKVNAGHLPQDYVDWFFEQVWDFWESRL